MNTTPQNAPENIQGNGEQPAVHVLFFCKDCEKVIDGIKIGRKYVYKCPLCGTKNVAFGTEKSIKSFYHIEAVQKP